MRVFGLLPRHFERGIYPPPGVYLLPLVLVWWENQQEINTPQYKPIHTRTSRNSKPQQAIYSPTYRKALYLLYFLATVRARTAPNTPKRKNTIDNLKKYQQIFEDLLTLLKNYFEADCFKSISFISGVSDFKSCKSSISLSDKPLFSG